MLAKPKIFKYIFQVSFARHYGYLFSQRMYFSNNYQSAGRHYESYLSNIIVLLKCLAQQLTLQISLMRSLQRMTSITQQTSPYDDDGNY